MSAIMKWLVNQNELFNKFDNVFVMHPFWTIYAKGHFLAEVYKVFLKQT